MISPYDPPAGDTDYRAADVPSATITQGVTVNRGKVEYSESRYMSEKVVPCSVYSRICGYFGRLKDWNKGKKQEFVERKTYEVPKEAACPTNDPN